ncbi:MAG TPA: hypothetical protein VFC63_07050 [Blastocatellia bacterium]|nr:hypothetical protein [Blastocatellia bacterium]
MYRHISSLLLAVSLVFIQVAFSQSGIQQEVLTNESIVKLTKSGVSSAVIIAKIGSSRNKFDLSASELSHLKEAAVPDDVVVAMLQASLTELASSPGLVVVQPPPVDSNDPNAPHEAGIWLLKTAEGSEKQMIQLEPSVFSGGKATGMGWALLTYGITKIKLKGVLREPNAHTQIEDPRPTFYFYFEVTNSGLSNSSWEWFSSATSPNEFVLVEMDTKKDRREAVLGSASVFTSHTGPENSKLKPFDFDKIAPGVFKVTPHEDLSPGEYMFYYGRVDSKIIKVFDFGIKP